MAVGAGFKLYAAFTAVVGVVVTLVCLPLFTGLFDGGWGALGWIFVIPIVGALDVPAIAALVVWKRSPRATPVACAFAILSAIGTGLSSFVFFATDGGEVTRMAIVPLAFSIVTIVVFARELRRTGSREGG